MKKSSVSTGKMVRLAILIAIMILFEVTNLGYLRLNPAVSITIMMVPVVVGAIITGPGGGALLGLVFGLTSFSQAFGKDPMGAVFLQINPLYLFLMCVVPRVFAGWVPGLLFKALRKTKMSNVLVTSLTALSGSLTNTALFIPAMWIFWHNQPLFVQTFGNISVFALFSILIVTNTLIEIAVNVAAGAAIGGVLNALIPVEKK